jgi:type VI secretion system protein VasI
MLKNCIICLLLMLPSVSNSAEITEGISLCTELTVAYQRLDCFDALAKKLREGDTSDPVLGKWRIEVTTDPLDDSESTTLQLDADSGKTRFGAPISLTIKCQSNDIDISVNWSSYMGSVPNVLTRIGNEEPETRIWRVSKDSLSTIHPAAKRFLFSMLNETQLVSRLNPYNSNPVTAIFNISGIDQAVDSVRHLCPIQ